MENNITTISREELEELREAFSKIGMLYKKIRMQLTLQNHVGFVEEIFMDHFVLIGLCFSSVASNS